MKVFSYFLLLVCMVMCFSGLYLGLDAHYSFRCWAHGFTQAEITMGGVVCSDRSGLEVWLRDLDNTVYGQPNGVDL